MTETFPIQLYIAMTEQGVSSGGNRIGFDCLFVRQGLWKLPGACTTSLVAFVRPDITDKYIHLSLSMFVVKDSWTK